MWLLATSVGCAGAPHGADGGDGEPLPPSLEVAHAADLSPGDVQAAAPPFSEGIYPCTDCHEEAGDPERREIFMHEEIQEAFDHDSEHRWCLDCHDNENRNMLRTASGELIPFTESYRLCGQCHGDKYRDWRAGIHGRRTGEWDGERTYFLCVHCHNPHSPAFEPIAPEPRPQRPEEMRQ
jgi:hypothetical protein